MASYNGGKFIRQQIDSIIKQLSPEDELIISDDNSTDTTRDVINSYSDERIKLLHHKRDEKIAATKCAAFRFTVNNFENALLAARGDFIFLSDQDDIWEFNKVKEILKELQCHDLVMCNFSIIDENNKLQRKSVLKKDPVNKYFIKNILYPPFLGCTMAFHKKILEYCLPFPYKLIGHDFWIGCLVCIKGTYKFIEKPLHSYRRHYSNVSSATNKSSNGFIFKISYRLVFILQIFLRLIKNGKRI
jgi:glycosyltransferase involved in cell wall biosynthesis